MNVIEIKALETLETLHNDTTGPAARMLTWRAAIRAAFETLGVSFTHHRFNDSIEIKKG